MIQLIIEPTSVFVIENGKIYEEESAVGYIIRDEVIISDEEESKNGISIIKSEKEKVAKGEAVYRYCSQNEEKLEEKIADLDIEIQKAMDEQDTSVYSTDIQLLEKQIDEQLDKLKDKNDLSEISEYKSEISSLMIKKAKIAGELSPAGSYINKLITERSQYENQLNSGQTYINATTSGLVSYKIDGYEEELNEENIDTITKEKLENIKLKTGQLISTSTEKGKIVNNFYCYIAIVLSSDNAKNASEGDTVKIRLANNDEVSAEIYKISNFINGEAVMFFKITKDVEYLMDYRKISVDVIWWSASGLKVPNSAIVTEDNKHYLIRSRVGYTDKILINVEKQNDTYAIIKNLTTQELIDMGYDTEKISNMKNISLYDQVLSNP
jgi:putative membrane fusion protein